MTWEENERRRLIKWLELAGKKLPLEKLKVLARDAAWYLDECGVARGVSPGGGTAKATGGGRQAERP
jgi:hypothetical protein